MAMMIRRLSEDVRGQLRTGVALTGVAQCVEELVLNSVDAGATCVAVRIDLQSVTIQVVDNGAGITKEQLPHVGQRLAMFDPHSWELRAQTLKSQLVRLQSLNVLPLKPGVGQYIAIYAMFTAKDFFLAYFYPSSPFTCTFSKTFHNLFICWLWLTSVPV